MLKSQQLFVEKALTRSALSLAKAKRYNLHVCIPLQVENRHLSSSLHSRRLLADGSPAQPPTDSDSPTWTLPGLDQVSPFIRVSRQCSCHFCA